MGKLRLFRDVIQDHFYNEIFGELSAYIEDNPTGLSIYNKFRDSQQNRFSGYLVPVISKSQLDNEADKFLRNTEAF